MKLWILPLKKEVNAILLLDDVFDSSAYRRSIDSFYLYLHEIAPSLIKAKEKDILILANNFELIVNIILYYILHKVNLLLYIK